jgi:hypothetical protein
MTRTEALDLCSQHGAVTQKGPSAYVLDVPPASGLLFHVDSNDCVDHVQTTKDGCGTWTVHQSVPAALSDVL